MSGGEWGYQALKLEEVGEMALKFFNALAETERICDWSESGDTCRADAEPKLYDLWVKTFNEVYH